MTEIELKKKLIGKINQTKNNEILEEMLRLILNEETDSVYELSPDQTNTVEEAQMQFRNGQFLTDEQADKKIDEKADKTSAEKIK